MQQPVYLMDEFYALLDFIPLPVLVFQASKDASDNGPHLTHYVNKEFSRVMGYEIGDIPDHLSWFQLAFPDSNDRQQIIQQWQSNISKPVGKTGDYLSSAVEIKCKNNEMRWFRIYTELKKTIFTGLYIVSFSDSTAEQEKKQLQRIYGLIDPLSNVVNKQLVLKRIGDEAARVNRFGDPFSILIVHIGNLMDIDEIHGQDGVTYALKVVAGILQSKVRKIDLVSRWGDNKFFILIPNANAEQAYKVNELILKKLKNFPFKFNNATLNLSVTIGIAEYQINENINHTLERADSALYFGKATGSGYIVHPHLKNNYALNSRFEIKL